MPTSDLLGFPLETTVIASYTRMRESEIKIAVVKWLLDQLAPSEIIASELLFSNGLNRADLVVSSPSRLSALEIKSSYDDFRRFENQQQAYRSAFLDAHLVVPAELLSTAREHLAPSTGILTIDQFGKLTQQRRAQSRSQLTRQNSIAWLRYADRQRIASVLGGKTSLDQLSERELTAIILRSIHERLKPRFDTFQLERGQSLNTDDLGMLSLPSKIR